MVLKIKGNNLFVDTGVWPFKNMKKVGKEVQIFVDGTSSKRVRRELQSGTIQLFKKTRTGFVPIKKVFLR